MLKKLIKIFIPIVLFFSALCAGASSSSFGSGVFLTVIGNCGNSILNTGEGCDDGNNISGDGCSSACVLEYCGDGIVNNVSELCDANSRSCVGSNGYAGVKICNNLCNGWNQCVESESCGDGVVNGSEVCDDGNNNNCDGCKSDCTRRDNVCGDGYLENSCGEECDNSLGLMEGYECSDLCKLKKKATGSNALVSVFSPINIYNITTSATHDSAVIDWLTNKEVYSSLEWGEDQEVSDGIVQKSEKLLKHKVVIDNLKSDTVYYFLISSNDDWGHESKTEILMFKTEKEADKKAPTNPDNFISTDKEGNVLLTWNNPKDSDFRAVKIIKSESFYPQSIADGVEIYNDSGENFLDTNVKVGTRYYYTIFAYDNNGNVSSGSLTSIVLNKVSDISRGENFGDNKSITENGDRDYINVESVLPFIPDAKKEEMIEVDMNYFDFFIANGKIKISSSSNISFLPGTIIDVVTGYNNYPRVLKSIIVSVVSKDKNDKTEYGNYVLKSSNDNSYYAANFSSPLKPGNYEMHLTFVNFKNLRIAKRVMPMVVKKFGVVASEDFDNNIISEAKADNGSDNPVYKAEITLYSYNNGTMRKWSSMSFSQFNPMFSNKLGQYGFLVPNGIYLIRVAKEGYYNYLSLPVYVKDNLVNSDIKLVYYPDLNISKFCGFLAILLAFSFVIFLLRRKSQDYRNQSC